MMKTRTMFALLAEDQPTAIAGSGVCTECFTPENCQQVIDSMTEPVHNEWHPVTGNGAIDCKICGRRGDTMNFAAPPDPEIREVPDDLPEPDGYETDFEEHHDPVAHNRYRGLRAGVGFRAYSEVYGDGNDASTQMQDFLVDLLHLCDVLDVSLQGALSTAEIRYAEEVEGE